MWRNSGSTPSPTWMIELLTLSLRETAAGAKAGTLQPWLVGLTAVVGFLLIVFVILIIHRLLKNKRFGVHIPTHRQHINQRRKQISFTKDTKEEENEKLKRKAKQPEGRGPLFSPGIL
uniref:Uncharacterized protein n=1 Tax=Gouania willdenowi TaxID=441366 RepID=A0A8C5ECH7_GOUWI